MSEQEVLHSPFDIETHKKTFINYLEVVINSDGTIEYAVPSHQEKLISIFERDRHKSRDWLKDNCPQEFYFDFTQWLCNITWCVAVWNDRIIKPDWGLTASQRLALKKLKESGLYNGEY